MGGEAFDDVLAESTDHDDVAHARHYLRRIFHRLAAAQLAVARVEVDGGTAQLMHAGFKRQAGAGRVFLEHHHQRAVEQRVVRFVILEFAFDETATFNHVLVFVQRKIRKLQVMFDCHK